MRTRHETPGVAWTYGVLGLIPFAVAGAALVIGDDRRKAQAKRGLILYAGLIASFLGGARWGLEIEDKPVRTTVISASMAPTVGGFLLALAPKAMVKTKFAGLIAIFAGQWLWDVRSSETPSWYPVLRTALTTGAVVALLVGLTTS